MLRDFVRTQVFERFPAALGASSGAAAIALCAWVGALTAGPRSMATFSMLWALLLATGLGAVAIPMLIRVARHHTLARAAEPLVFAICFSLVALAAAVGGTLAALTLLGLLLAALGLSAAGGFWLLQAGSTAAAALTAAALARGFWTLGGRTEVTRQRIEIAGLPAALAGLRITHLSDLHIGNGVEGARLDAIVAAANALAADLIVISGDIFDNDAAVLTDGAGTLARLTAPLGVYAVLGNHDGFAGGDDVVAALAAEAPGIEVLRGRCLSLKARAALHIAGFDDPGHDWKPGDPSPELDALAAVRPADATTLLLMHRPDAFPRAAERGFALVLSGHFHGGQVALPLAGGRWNAARLLTRFDRGLHREGRAALYVSRGLGFVGPRLRFASSPEIAVHELWPAGPAGS